MLRSVNGVESQIFMCFILDTLHGVWEYVESWWIFLPEICNSQKKPWCSRWPGSTSNAPDHVAGNTGSFILKFIEVFLLGHSARHNILHVFLHRNGKYCKEVTKKLIITNKKVDTISCHSFTLFPRNGTFVGCCILPNAQNISVVLLCHSSPHLFEKGYLFTFYM